MRAANEAACGFNAESNATILTDAEGPLGRRRLQAFINKSDEMEARAHKKFPRGRSANDLILLGF
jgi:hypothetical protein